MQFAKWFALRLILRSIVQERRGTQQELKWPDDKRVMLVYKMPLSEIIFDFFDKLKQISSGYATLDYEECGYEESNLVKMTCLVNGEPVDPLSVITHRSKVVQTGKNLVSKLKDVIARQMFEIKLQAAVRIVGIMCLRFLFCAD
jgi:GTP-binding protein LepA